MATRAKPKAIIIGISGVSTSGKTTLARLLRDIFPGSRVLHGDDFYKKDSQIPVRDGVQDWDCVESLDLDLFRDSLQSIRNDTDPPPGFRSKEDENEVQPSNVDLDLITKLKDEVSKNGTGDSPPLVIVEGFLLYAQEMRDIWESIDVRMFLHTDYKTAKARRESRSGYVTLEGFWEDPPGYVDKVVWPNYVQDHKFLFIDQDVANGRFNESICKDMNLQVMPEDADGDMSKCLLWAYQEVQRALQQRR